MAEKKSWFSFVTGRKKQIDDAVDKATGPVAAPVEPPPQKPAVDTSDDYEYETTPEGTRRKRIRF